MEITIPGSAHLPSCLSLLPPSPSMLQWYPVLAILQTCHILPSFSDLYMLFLFPETNFISPPSLLFNSWKSLSTALDSIALDALLTLPFLSVLGHPKWPCVLNTLHQNRQDQSILHPQPGPPYTYTGSTFRAYPILLCILRTTGLATQINVGGLNEWQWRLMLLYLWKSIELLGSMIKFCRVENGMNLQSLQEEIWHLFWLLSPCPAQPIASSLGVRLYLWEVHWAVGPKAWAQDPPLLRANYMTV